MTGSKSATIKFTKNFESNLSVIEAHWTEAEYPQAYDRLLEEIGDTIIPNLERFPAMGRSFTNRQAGSVEALSKQALLHKRLARLKQGSDLREYVIEDYLVLYAVIGDTVYLLSIRHHKQLSFDFAHLWLDGK